MAVAVSRASGQDDMGTVWAGTEPSALFRSDDGGLSWRECSALRDLAVRAHLVLPAATLDAPRALDRPRRGRAGAHLRGYRARWGHALPGRRPHLGGPQAQRPARCPHPAHPPLAPGRVYEAAGGGYAESRDGGASWLRLDEGMAHHYCWSLAVDSADPDTVIVSATHGPMQAHQAARAEATVYRKTAGQALAGIAQWPPRTSRHSGLRPGFQRAGAALLLRRHPQRRDLPLGGRRPELAATRSGVARQLPPRPQRAFRAGGRGGVKPREKEAYAPSSSAWPSSLPGWREPHELATLPRTWPLWAYLLLHRSHPVKRETLAFTLWPDEPEASARANLRRHLHDLKRILPPPAGSSGPDWLLVDARTIQWNPECDYWLDVMEFERLSGSADTLAEAVALYEGDFLESSYDDWLFYERERLRDLYLADLSQLTMRSRADATTRWRPPTRTRCSRSTLFARMRCAN